MAKPGTEKQVEKKTIEVIVGKRAEGSLDPARRVKGLSSPADQGEVGGRWHWEYIVCPWDGAINHLYVSDVSYYWYECWRCGNNFTA